jgi:hypothetical protein
MLFLALGIFRRLPLYSCGSWTFNPKSIARTVQKTLVVRYQREASGASKDTANSCQWLKGSKLSTSKPFLQRPKVILAGMIGSNSTAETFGCFCLAAQHCQPYYRVPEEGWNWWWPETVSEWYSYICLSQFIGHILATSGSCDLKEGALAFTEAQWLRCSCFLCCRRGFFDKRLAQEVSGDSLGDVSTMHQRPSLVCSDHFFLDVHFCQVGIFFLCSPFNCSSSKDLVH